MNNQNFQDWLSKNQNLSRYFFFIDQENKSPKNQNSSKIKNMINPLTSLIKKLDKKSHKIVEAMMSKSQESLIKLANFKEGDNLILTSKRKVKYVSYKIRQLEVKSLSVTLNVIMNHMDDAKKLLKLFTNYASIIPNNIVIQIPESFFTESKPISYQKINVKIHRLQSYLHRNVKFLESLEPPLWVCDFPSYFDQAIENAMKQFDSSLSYSLCVPEETYISKAIFSSQTQLLEKIDNLVETIGTIPNSNFVSQVFDFCYSIIPNAQSKTTNELSVSLMIFYRIIFDRLYEKHSNFLFLDLNSNFEYISKISLIPVKNYRFPDDFPIKPEISIREFIHSFQILNNGAIDLNVSSFVTNPVDALYYVDRALSYVRESRVLFVKDDDQNRFLSFDDVFSLFLGIYLTSDLPNIFSLQYFIDTYSPKSLSHKFEYASSAVTALVLHLKELIKKCKQEENA